MPGAYLLPSVGASALALGGAYTASAEHFSPWWNPAALANLREKRFAAGVGMRSMGRTEAVTSFEFRVPPRVGIGLFLLYRGDPFLDDLYDENEKPIEDASYSSYTGKIALSYLVNRKVGAGASITILYQRLPISSENGAVIYSSGSGIGAVDFAVNYKHSDKLTLAATAKNLWALLTWESNGYSSITAEDRPLPLFTIGGVYESVVHKKPFIWHVDLKGQWVDGEFSKLDRPQAQFNIGWEWRYWETFYLRAGLGDILINGDLIRDTESYFDQSGIRISTGCSFDLSKIRNGLKVNYGISTDKLWAGIDHQLDCVYTF
jgi:hypothetical protein